MTGPVDDRQDQPFNQKAWTHQYLLLKSLHCCRPVVHQGLNQFIQCMTVNLSGCDIEMTVYLRGIKDGIDSTDLQIKTEERKENA